MDISTDIERLKLNTGCMILICSLNIIFAFGQIIMGNLSSFSPQGGMDISSNNTEDATKFQPEALGIILIWYITISLLSYYYIIIIV